MIYADDLLIDAVKLKREINNEDRIRYTWRSQ